MDIRELYNISRDNVLNVRKKLAEKIPVYLKALSENKKLIKFFNLTILFFKVTGIVFGFILMFFFVTPLLQEVAISFKSVKSTKFSLELTEKQITGQVKKLEKSNAILSRKFNRKTPQQPYLVVNSTINEFAIYKGTNLIREGKCSTGSYIMLQAADERKWIFQTPRGVFRIQGKITSPVWIKPDWAFIEEGLPVPSKYSYDRYEYGVLGDYAMSIGHGYLIHGTLYQRFLGMPVTHGCIRLGDDDLEAVYRNLDIGSKVFIY